MPARFDNDPFRFALRAFDDLHPELDVTIHWVPDVLEAVGQPERKDEVVLGVTIVDPETGQPTGVFLGMNQAVSAALPTLIHELAHVAAGCVDNAHGPEWQAAEDALWARYAELVHEAASANGGKVMDVYEDLTTHDS